MMEQNIERDKRSEAIQTIRSIPAAELSYSRSQSDTQPDDGRLVTVAFSSKDANYNGPLLRVRIDFMTGEIADYAVLLEKQVDTPEVERFRGDDILSLAQELKSKILERS